MCRLLGFSVESKIEEKRLQDIIYTSRELLKDQKDGFGYALSGGDIQGIASLRLTTGTMLGYQFEPAGEWENLVNVPYEKRGEVLPCTAGLFHGRTSTNHVKIQNSHPFVSERLALAHNGIVEYDGKKRRKAGTCDSEDLFNTFTVGKGWRELSRNYSGYAAILMVKANGEIIIYRDSTPQLYMCKVGGGIVVGTSMLDVTTLAKKFCPNPSAPWHVLPDIAFTCINGHKAKQERVKPMPRRSYGTSDQLSLGHSYTPTPTGEDNEKSPFPDYDKEEMKTTSYYDGVDAGYEDGISGKQKQIMNEELDYQYAKGYSDGYDDGKDEIQGHLAI